MLTPSTSQNNEKLKLKNVNLDYYGIKARSSSRQQKNSQHLDVMKHKKRQQIMIDNNISKSILDSIILTDDNTHTHSSKLKDSKHVK